MRALGRVAAVAMGLVWGFFVAFNVVFSDVFGVSEMAGAVVFVFVAYVLLGAVFGAAGPRTGSRWAWWLAPPGVLLVAVGLADNVARVVYHAAVIAAVVGGTLGGAVLGVKVREYLGRRRGHGGASPTA